jgi:hypothetical protein
VSAELDSGNVVQMLNLLAEITSIFAKRLFNHQLTSSPRKEESRIVTNKNRNLCY